MGVWKCFKTPDGTPYYFNTLTKHSSWDRPEDFGLKKQKNHSNPLYALPLMNKWYLIICDDGKKFYFYNGNSQYTLDDIDSQQLLEKVDKQLLCLLIGVARGYNCPKRNIYEEVYNELIHLKNITDIKKYHDEQYNRVISSTNKCPEIQNSEALITGYSSSDDSCQEEIENQISTFMNSEDFSDSDLDDLNDLENSNSVVEEPSKKYFDLFDRYNLDPYSTWESQSQKLNRDPEFYAISRDDEKVKLFNKWCCDTLSCKQNSTSQDFIESFKVTAKKRRLNMTKYHYLAHIVSKSKIEPTTIFHDIKNSNKKLFKLFKIKKLLNYKEQQMVVSQLLFYYKKFPILDRIILFNKLLDENKDIIKIHQKDIKGVRDVLFQEKLPDSFDEIENQLMLLETWIGIHDKLSHLQVEIQYYILGIEDKIIQLKKIIKSLI